MMDNGTLAIVVYLLYALLMTDYDLRLEAAQRGEKRYIGKPCEHHAGGQRYTSNGACVICTAEKSSERVEKIRALLKRNA